MKYNIDIIGTCCSRELFNTSKLSEMFSVQNYVFQTLIWACFHPSLGVDSQIINNSHNANFTKRMMNFDLNKEGLNSILKNRSEFIMVDLVSLTFPFCKCTYRDTTTFARNFEQPNCFKELKKVCPEFAYIECDYREANSNIIKKGLIDLADWIKKNYKQENVVVNIPMYARQWLNKEYQKKAYSHELQEAFNNKNAYLQEFYTFFIAQFDTSLIKILKSTSEKTSRNYNLTEDYSGLHYLKEDNEKQANILIDILNMEYEKFKTRDLSGLSYWAEKDSTTWRSLNRKLWEQSTKSLPMIVHYRLINQNEINSYFKELANIDDDIIVCFAVKDSASKYIDKVESFCELNLAQKIKYRQPYACINVPKEKLIIESSANDATSCRISYDFSIDLSIAICSQAYSAIPQEKANPTFFEIIQNGKCYKYIATLRGLNILVYSRKHLGVIDFFGVDLHGDAKMEIIR